MDKYKNEKELVARHDLKDSADDFIQHSQDIIDVDSSTRISEQSEYLKKQFIKRKQNLESFLPPQKDDSKDEFVELGSFKSDVGEVSVGYRKFEPKTDLRFTLISEKEKEYDEKSSKLDFKDDRNYFRKSLENQEKEYQENDTTLEFDSKDKTIKRVNEIFSDEISVGNDEILYDDELEDQQLENLEEVRSIDPVSVDNAISDMRDIKNEKKDDNNRFRRDIEEFSNFYLKDKLKRFEDADQLGVAMDRLSSDNLYVLLKKRMEEMRKLKKELCVVINSILVKKLKKKGVE